MQNDFDPFDLTAEEANAQSVNAKANVGVEQDVEDFLWLMRDKRGRRFVWRLLTWTHVFKTSFTGNSETYFREGERNIGCRLIDEIHTTCPELYTAMVKEQKNG